jgi:hypothetical protein
MLRRAKAVFAFKATVKLFGRSIVIYETATNKDKIYLSPNSLTI